MNYKEELRKKLPELKDIEGFPIGKEDDILELSTPPYYTACPNPFIEQFLKQKGKTYNSDDDNYKCEPFTGDVSEGKNDPIYNAHTYHTKVPPKAIEHYINHYTSEGDIVLDGFSGTGMMGVAAQKLNRNAILLDLAPIAAFISFNYNSLIDRDEYLNQYSKVFKEIKDEFGWMYHTNHQTANTSLSGAKGVINYVVWSDVLECPLCSHQFDYYQVDSKKDSTKRFNCPSCEGHVSKDECDRVREKHYDSFLNMEVEINRQVPVLINYTYSKKRFEKEPDDEDFALLHKIESYNPPYWAPAEKMMFKDGPWGDIYRAGYHFGMTHSHHFYTKRNLIILSAFWNKFDHHLLKWTLTSILNYVNKRQSYSGGGGGMPGVLFVASLVQEKNVFDVLQRKFKKIAALLKTSTTDSSNTIVSTQSVTDLRNITSDSIDYIFTDPPFGDNIMYSEASFLWESWLKVYTNNKSEAIINRSQKKELQAYYDLMKSAFTEYYRVLKPNRWITIEFHNSKSKVWNIIQESILKAGFIIGQVSILDKKQGSFKQVTSAGAVKSDLVISAFKPNKAFEESFISNSGKGLEVAFVNDFLAVQPTKGVIDRTEKMLYSKMLSYYIQRGYEINHDAKSFYSLLKSNFIEEDGFWFTSDQINSYIEYKKYAKLNEIEEIKSGGLFLFVTDEKSALVWLHNFLNQPKSFSDVSVAFNQLANIQDDQVPELRDLLEENFVFEGGIYRRPKSEEEHNQITEKRQKHLWKEFETILIQAQTERKKIKEVRKEALSYGFEHCYKDKRFKDILTIASKLHPSILENNGELADFVEAAEIQTEGLT